MNFQNLIEICAKNNLHITKVQAEQLNIFCNFVLKKNKDINLTAIVDENEFVVKHLVDSLKLESLIKLNRSANFLDIGAGAGFPSVPLAIVRPDLKVVQLDCLQKRVKFLKQAEELLKLRSKVVHGRAEELGRKLYFREKFKFVTARAVAKLNILVEYALPFVEIGGLFIALKGRNYFEELTVAQHAIVLLGGRLEKIEEFEIGNGIKRCLILIRKISQTPTKYPRINSKILKSAL